MITLLHGDCRETLITLPAQSVQCIVTSPPYYGLRKYTSDPREIGQEATPALYVAALVAVFAECWRVLRDDGTLWCNIGDSYGTGSGGNGTASAKQQSNTGTQIEPRAGLIGMNKQLLGMPWRVALALQADGWILRSDIIWAKPNCMPESVTDRPTRAHEYVFLFAKKPRYFYDAAAIREPILQASLDRINMPTFDQQTGGPKDYGTTGVNRNRSMRKTLENFKKSAASGTRNKRTVWTIATQPYSEAHFATMPEALIEPCILAGSSAQACETCGAAWGRESEPTGHVNAREPAHQPGNTATKTDSTGWAPTTRSTDRFAPRCQCAVNIGGAASVVLDPFGGSGTVAKVAQRLQRNAILIDLNQAYIELQEKRTDGVQVELFV